MRVGSLPPLGLAADGERRDLPWVQLEQVHNPVVVGSKARVPVQLVNCSVKCIMSLY